MKQTWFERAIFFSWYCGIRDCAYCFMSTQPDSKKAVRSKESLLAELLLCKKLGWKIGFISGGIGAFSQTKFKDLLKDMYKVSGEKFWLNIGALTADELKEYLPYTKGVVGSIETVNERIHDKICPSKPMEPYFEMFEDVSKLGLKNAMTIILGLGETIKDFAELKNIVEKYNITKVHFYGLNPQKGTVFEKSDPPSAEYQAEWIKKTREEFPKIDIQCGIWVDRVDRVAKLLKAGANSISKFPILKKFGSKEAKEIERQAKLAGREFRGTLTKLPEIDWDGEISKLDLAEELKEKIKNKLRLYLKKMQKNYF
ncbi:radical SAM protein [Candidatus Woesearchaeota archaeon]|nr:radical SAM protein [Candidatus Woesearchaeota archaeon]